jgi:hypothetical protein
MQPLRIHARPALRLLAMATFAFSGAACQFITGSYSVPDGLFDLDAMSTVSPDGASPGTACLSVAACCNKLGTGEEEGCIRVANGGNEETCAAYLTTLEGVCSSVPTPDGGHTDAPVEDEGSVPPHDGSTPREDGSTPADAKRPADSSSPADTSSPEDTATEDTATEDTSEDF